MFTIENRCVLTTLVSLVDKVRLIVKSKSINTSPETYNTYAPHHANRMAGPLEIGKARAVGFAID